MNVFLCLWVSLCRSPGGWEDRFCGWFDAMDAAATFAGQAAGKLLTPIIKEGMTPEQVERFLGTRTCIVGGLRWCVYERWGIVVDYYVEIDASSPDPMQWKARCHVWRAYHMSGTECPIRVYRAVENGKCSVPDSSGSGCSIGFDCRSR
jgi:hypothetical protein